MIASTTHVGLNSNKSFKFFLSVNIIERRLYGNERGYDGRETLYKAQLLLTSNDLLLLDEPTNHLDIESKEVLVDALEQFAGTIVAVSHDRYFLDKIFPGTYWLAGGELTRYERNYSFAGEKRNVYQ
ncbi:hypothetical protein GCM10007063_32400 [Lentibacillus kapialis]|uniref:ABC transporter ATP-binding protein n=1 Tax=Lentibacillus kapialis TaxID=340214 RepID=A0A917Q277_9BACI|nr:hypothetical protein GCM10007063_32400 [Lentibacillus kapialis]